MPPGRLLSSSSDCISVPVIYELRYLRIEEHHRYLHTWSLETCLADTEKILQCGSLPSVFIFSPNFMWSGGSHFIYNYNWSFAVFPCPGRIW
jgi:hypothetical protein